MIRLHYPRLFTFNDPEFQSIQQLARNTYELTQFLTQIAPPKELHGTFAGRVTYHDSCSGFRELKVYDEPRALLARLPGVALNEMHRSSDCCGFGGAFAVKFGEISSAICEHKCAHIAATGAAAVVGGDLGCLLNIEGRLRRRGDTTAQVLHIAEVLAGEGDACA
jgi:L-lactate dehydrogenase complex protein LldE